MRSTTVVLRASFFSASILVGGLSLSATVVGGPPAGLEASFRIAGGSAAPGESVRLPFLVSSNEALGGVSFSVDFDEEVLEATEVEIVYSNPSGADWLFVSLDFDNSNVTPGNAGIDEGFLLGGVLFAELDLISMPPVPFAFLPPPVDQENELLAFHLAVRPEAAPGETEISFLDGAQGAGQPITNVASVLPGYSAELNPNPAQVDVDAGLLQGLLAITAPTGLFIRGDANLDGELDLSDALTILGHLFQRKPLLCLAAADVDDGGELDLSDPVRLLGHVFRGTAAPAAPFPAPGEDPTPDLGCGEEV